MEMNDKKKILIIEDNEASMKWIQTYLTNQGFQTASAMNGIQGLNAARDAKPDLILLDLLLPDMNGHKVCRMIKFDRTLSHIPVVVWTSRDTEEDADLAKNCGADAFIVKTTRIEILLGVIKKLLESKGKEVPKKD
jgi:DNA-binding response OmpR family regulator